MYSGCYWAGAMQLIYNYLAKYRSTDVIGIMNCDVTFGKDYLSTVKRLVKKDVLVTYAGSGIYFDFKHWKHQYSDNPNCAPTRSLFMTFETYKNIGGWHPFLLPQYLSDYEYTLRATRMGYKIITDDKLVIHTEQRIHNEGVFSKLNPGNPVYQSAFILLACPWLWKLPNIIRVWIYALINWMRK